MISRVTASPGTLNQPSGDPDRTPEEPSSAAFGLLSRAQALADRLQADVEAEVAELRADAHAAHDEARRLLSDATSVHEDALSAQRSAQARLQEAQEESAQLIADAADQATLVADAAARTSENLVASTQVEGAGNEVLARPGSGVGDQRGLVCGIGNELSRLLLCLLQAGLSRTLGAEGVFVDRGGVAQQPSRLVVRSVGVGAQCCHLCLNIRMKTIGKGLRPRQHAKGSRAGFFGGVVRVA